MKRFSGLVIAAAIAFCAATPASSQMFLDRFSNECKKGALYGAVGGGVIGAIVGGKGDRLEGAAIGAAAGTVAGCLISKKMTQDDHGKLLALEKKAAKAGVPKSGAWTNSSKNKIAATAFPGPVTDGCRDVKVDLSVDGGKAENFAGDRLCKTSKGWVVAS